MKWPSRGQRNQDTIAPIGVRPPRRFTVKLGKIIEDGVKRLTYTYDFGDDWRHTVTIEAVGAADPAMEYPRFVDGARRAPPEDVGDWPGFEQFLEAMARLRHPERKDLIRWYGRVFDPDDMGLADINKHIGKLNRAGFAGGRFV